MLKRILLGIAVLAVVVLVVAFSTATSFSSTREITINKPLPEVFAYVKLLKNQDNFSKWATMDPAMKKTFRGEDGTVGFVSAWESENPDVGVGEQEIKAIVENERIDYELRFSAPFESTSTAWMTTSAASDSTTTVSWGMKGEMPVPMNLMLLFMDMESAMGDDFMTGLTNLKALLETQPEPASEPVSAPADS